MTNYCRFVNFDILYAFRINVDFVIQLLPSEADSLYDLNRNFDFIRKFISEFSVFSAIIRRFFRSVLDGKLNKVW